MSRKTSRPESGRTTLLEAGEQPLFDPKEYPEIAKLPKAQQGLIIELHEAAQRLSVIKKRRAYLQRTESGANQCRDPRRLTTPRL